MIIKSIPNLFTLANLALGTLAVILVINGKFEHAAFLIIIAMLCDGLDGRVARALNVQSEFGKELDSLSDLISFGLAPAAIMYGSTISDLNPVLAWSITVLFPICGALRLARFNVIPPTPGYFIGLPIPAAGGILCALSLFRDELSPSYIMIGCGVLSYLMVSSVRYPSFKRVKIPKKLLWVLPILTLIIIWLGFRYERHLPKVIFIPLFLYALYGLKKDGNNLSEKLNKK